MKKRTLLVIRLLACLLLTGLLVVGIAACGQKKPDPTPPETENGTDEATTPNEEATTEPSPYLDNLGTYDLKGTTIKLAARSNERYVNEMWVAEQTENRVNNLVYARNKAVETRLNCIIEQQTMGNANHGPVRDGLETQLQAGDCDIDLIAGSMYMSLVHASNGYYKDLLKYNALDIEKPYWSTKFIQEATINNKVYTVTGDAALTSRQSAMMMMFNKTLLSAYNLDDPYELVRNKQWTIDKLITMTKDIYVDVNHDETLDADDFYGFAMSNRCGLDAWNSALGITLLSRDENNLPKTGIDSDKFFAAYGKVYKLLFDNNGGFALPFKGNDLEMNDAAIGVANGKYIFAVSWIRGMELEDVRNAKNPYGVLPMPKYDENQNDYYSFMHDQLSVLSIPFTVSEERAADVVAPFMEALASESRISLMPKYYEVILKRQLADAPDDAEMLDVISAGIKVDFAFMCQGNAGGLQTAIRDNIQKKVVDPAESFKTKKDSCDTKMAAFVEKFVNLDKPKTEDTTTAAS